MPSSHRRYKDWTLDRILREALQIGPSTAMLCQVILEHRPHPEQGFRSCMGIVRLAKSFSARRVEAACERGLHVGAKSYGSIKSILDNRLDGQPVRRVGAIEEDEVPAVLHPNIRGSDYYH